MIKDQCDPVYDETLEYSGRLNELRIRRLELQVVSKKTFARNPVLGMVSRSDLSGALTRRVGNSIAATVWCGKMAAAIPVLVSWTAAVTLMM